MAFATEPSAQSYDVVIIGGAIMGSSTAWFLSQNPDFQGRVLVIERDMNYELCSTAHTNSCVRQQFSDPLNVKISQFTADFVTNLRSYMGEKPEVPELSIRSFGYMYLADNAAFADVLRANQKIQVAAGAATEVLSAHEIQARYPFYNVDDIVLGTINTVNEGYWDGAAVFECFRREARANGVEYIENEVVAITRDPKGQRVQSVTLRGGAVIACGQVVNACGPRADVTAKMVGIDVPVEPRKRFSWVFKAQDPLDQDLPLTIDPSGVHVRENGGGTYQCGAHTEVDPRVAADDFEMDNTIWQEHVWPIIATRIPQFEAVKVTAEWAGHYAMNVFDQNAILGAHPEVGNFMFQNGFSGHGLQQSPAMGRGMSELLIYGEFRSLDLSPFAFERIVENRPMIETAVI